MFKKLDELESLLKQFKASIKMPKLEGVKPMKNKAPTLPGLPKASKKDPVKVAQQIENADVKQVAVEGAKGKKEALSTSKSGQWSLGKSDIDRTAYKFKHAATAGGNSAYHVMHDGNHVGTLSVSHKDNSVSGQLHPSHEGHRDFVSHAVKAFHIAKHTNTDN